MNNATTSKRDRLFARLARKCARLYDAKTPARARSTLSLEVSFLRAQLGCMGVEAMSVASLSTEEC